jgi:hypothetical protein
MTHAPSPVTPPDGQPPKPQNPEPLQQPVDPERRGTHTPPPPSHGDEETHEHPKEKSPGS